MAKNDITIAGKKEIARLRKQERALQKQATASEKVTEGINAELALVVAQIEVVEAAMSDDSADAKPSKGKKDKKAVAEEKPAKGKKGKKETAEEKPAKGKKGKKETAEEKPAKGKKGKKAAAKADAKGKKSTKGKGKKSNADDFDDFEL